MFFILRSVHKPHSDFQNISLVGKMQLIFSQILYTVTPHSDLNSFYLAAGADELPVTVTGIC
jgi:hypothetical protein